MQFENIPRAASRHADVPAYIASLLEGKNMRVIPIEIGKNPSIEKGMEQRLKKSLTELLRSVSKTVPDQLKEPYIKYMQDGTLPQKEEQRKLLTKLERLWKHLRCENKEEAKR